MTRERHKCGCVEDGRRWIEQCAEHRAEHDAYKAAHLDHLRRVAEALKQSQEV
jgi:hypothetical protein